MKKLIGILLAFLFVGCAQAVDRITATITVTNAPTTNGMSIQVNSDLRTWTNNATGSPATTILTNAAIGGVTTNLFNHLATYPVSGNAILLGWVATNQIKLVGASGGALTVAFTGPWASVSYTTQVVAQLKAVRVPISGEPTGATAISIASQLVDGINTLSTTSFTEGTLAMTNMVGKTATETITGQKYLSKGLISSNTTSLAFNGNLSVLNTNGIYGMKNGGTSTNTYWVLGFDSFGFPTIHDSGDIYPKSLPDDLGGVITYYVLTKYFPMLTDSLQTNHWDRQNEFNKATMNSGTATNLDVLSGQITGNLTNTVAYAGGPAESTVSSLANGVNAAVPLGGYKFIRLTAGPTLAFSIDGIAAPASGKGEVWIWNNTGQAMTVNHQSGSDPTAANRIISLTGAAQTTTGDGLAHFIYSAASSRWLMVSFAP